MSERIERCGEYEKVGENGKSEKLKGEDVRQ